MMAYVGKLIAALMKPVADAVAEREGSRRGRRDVGWWGDTLTLVVLTGAGLFCPWGVERFYGALLTCFVCIAAPVLLAAGVITFFGERSPRRLQGPRKRPAFIARGARDTTVAAWVGACFGAWALSRSWAGLPTGLVWDVEQAGGYAVAIGRTLLGLLALDAWLYWKHRLLHTRLLFAWHRAHHGYRDPTPFSGFSVGPVESLLTFWPLALVAIPQAVHWAPMYFGLVVGFILLNLYLHCGFSSPLLEATLPRLLVNTSVFHNVHHANAEVNFGEASTLWDILCKTRLSDRSDSSVRN